MKNYVILLAGGSGKRMQAEIPKQFIEVKGKPIIVYTLEKFQENNQIEAVVVVCVKDWTEHLKLLLEQYKLTKVRWVTIPYGTASSFCATNLSRTILLSFMTR